MSSVNFSNPYIQTSSSVIHSFSSAELLQKGIESNDCNAIQNMKLSYDPLTNGELPLHYAIRKGSPDIVVALLQKLQC